MTVDTGVLDWLEFCAEDPVRHQLLIQRPIPGFAPSAESYRVAVEVLDLTPP